MVRAAAPVHRRIADQEQGHSPNLADPISYCETSKGNNR